jgi:hypothetical protein
MRGKNTNSGGRFSKNFTRDLYKNMWQFMNQDMIRTMYGAEMTKNGIHFSKMKDVDDDKFTYALDHNDSICFKGEPDDGHWVYVDSNLIAHSTYEDKLLKGDDDGMCHGAAMINAFESANPQFQLIPRPKTMAQSTQNYRNLILFYIYLIESHKWDKALAMHFAANVKWYNKRLHPTTAETKISLDLLKKELANFP